MARKKKLSAEAEALNFFNNNWAVAELKVTYIPTFHTNIIIEGAGCIYVILTEFWKQQMVDYLEMMVAVFMNNRNEVIGYKVVSTGSMTSTTFDTRYICSLSLMCGAASVILAHNHPSGNLFPSDADISVTKKIKVALASIDIRLLDHLIITSRSYLSVLNYI